MNSQPIAKVEIYTISECPYCMKAKDLFQSKSIDFSEINLDNDPDRTEMIERTTNKSRFVPQIFINDQHILGGCDGLFKLNESGELDKLISNS